MLDPTPALSEDMGVDPVADKASIARAAGTRSEHHPTGTAHTARSHGVTEAEGSSAAVPDTAQGAPSKAWRLAAAGMGDGPPASLRVGLDSLPSTTRDRPVTTGVSTTTATSADAPGGCARRTAAHARRGVPAERITSTWPVFDRVFVRLTGVHLCCAVRRCRVGCRAGFAVAAGGCQAQSGLVELGCRPPTCLSGGVGGGRLFRRFSHRNRTGEGPGTAGGNSGGGWGSGSGTVGGGGAGDRGRACPIGAG